MADAVDKLLIAIELGDEYEAAGAAFDIVTMVPSPARSVSLSARQVQRLADLLDRVLRNESDALAPSVACNDTNGGADAG